MLGMRFRSQHPLLRSALIALPLLFVVAFLDADLAAALAAPLALVGVGLQLAENQRQARSTLTYNYLARWEHPDFFPSREAAGRFLELSKSTPDDRWRQWVEGGDPPQTRIQITAVFDFWEEVAGAYNHGLLDDDVFRSGMAHLLNAQWERWEWFISKAREDDANVFGEWWTARECVKSEIEQLHEHGKRRAVEALSQGEDLLKIRPMQRADLY